MGVVFGVLLLLGILLWIGIPFTFLVFAVLRASRRYRHEGYMQAAQRRGADLHNQRLEALAIQAMQMQKNAPLPPPYKKSRP